MFFQVLGEGSDQHLTIQWNQIRFTGGVAGDTITFQTQLFADGRVQYNYQDLASALPRATTAFSASVGIKGVGTQGPDPCCWLSTMGRMPSSAPARAR